MTKRVWDVAGVHAGSLKVARPDVTSANTQTTQSTHCVCVCVCVCEGLPEQDQAQVQLVPGVRRQVHSREVSNRPTDRPNRHLPHTTPHHTTHTSVWMVDAGRLSCPRSTRRARGGRSSSPSQVSTHTHTHTGTGTRARTRRTKHTTPPNVCTPVTPLACVCVWMASEGSFGQVSFVNSIATIKGGTHVAYVVDQLCTAISKKVRMSTGRCSGRSTHTHTHTHT